MIADSKYPLAQHYIDELAQYASGRQLLIKLGGALLDDEKEFQALAEALSVLQKHEIGAIIVHGGGPQLSAAMKQRGLESKFIDGKRFTDENALNVAISEFNTLSEQVKEKLESSGVNASTLSGSEFITAHRNPKLGFVGDYVKKINSAKLQNAAQQNSVLVVNSLAVDNQDDTQALNVNADTVFKEIAFAIAPHRLMSLTGVGGMFSDGKDGTNIIDSVDASDIQNLIDDGVITDGMAIKVQELASIVTTLPPGSAISITKPSSILDDLLTPEGAGTYIANGPKLHWYPDWHNQQDAISKIITKAFGRDLPTGYFENTKPVAVVLTHDLSACAIVSKLSNGLKYLDKLAVVPESQGRGIAQHMWYALKQKNPEFLWRSQSKNSFIKWYESQADYQQKNDTWQVFTTGYSQQLLESSAEEILNIPTI